MPRAARHDLDGDTREQILRCALDAFSEQGFSGSSTRDIATRAGVNHGLIPYYFGTKDKLWQAAVELAFADLEQGLEGLRADPDLPDDRAHAGRLVRAYIHFVAQNPHFVRLMHEEGKRRGPRMRWLVDRHVQPLYDAIARLLERGKASGTVKIVISPVHFFYILAGAGVVFHQAEECKRLSGVDPFDPEFVEAHARLVEAMILGAAEGSQA